MLIDRVETVIMRHLINNNNNQFPFVTKKVGPSNDSSIVIEIKPM
jgi:hypothetical protein